MTKTTIENISDGPRGYWHNGSLKTLAMGEAREVEADEAKSALSNKDYFAEAKAKPTPKADDKPKAKA